MFMKTSLLAGIMAFVLSVSGSALTAAESPNGTRTEASQESQKACRCPNFVDADGNGICDRKEQGACPGGQGWGRGQGRGACRGFGGGRGGGQAGSAQGANANPQENGR